MGSAKAGATLVDGFGARRCRLQCLDQSLQKKAGARVQVGIMRHHPDNVRSVLAFVAVAKGCVFVAPRLRLFFDGWARRHP